MSARSVCFCLSLGVASLVGTGGCRPQNDAETARPSNGGPLASYQEELLDTAFAAASAMPVFPHIKNRCRAQEVVVTTCIELNRPERARRYIEQIDNWRRGLGYANLAGHYARQGTAGEQVEPLLRLAAGVLEEAGGWRKDRIEATIAAVRAYLGQADGMVPSIARAELGPVARAKARTCRPEAFDTQMAALAQQVAADDFEVISNALGAYAELYRRFYADPARRVAIQDAVEAAWEPVPVLLRVEVCRELAEVALAHDDRTRTLELVGQARTIVDGARWQAEIVIPRRGRLAQLQARAGDESGARTQAQALLDLFDAQRETIANIYWAEMIRPVAEVYVALGDETLALDLYKRAIEAGMENPNSKPRADDLVATCCSMALHEVEPDAALATRIREIRDGLGEPW